MLISLNRIYVNYIMNPYIINIDRTKPIGKLIDQYGECQYNNGFLIGFLCGFSICALCCVILHKKYVN